MLRVNGSKSVARAVTDYLFKYLERDALGCPRWLGKAAERLGLNGKDFSGIPTEEVFFLLASNLDPNTGGPLTERYVTNRRVGYEFTTDGSKSGSIRALVLKEDGIVDAFRQVGGEMMEQLETDMKCRVRVGGAQHDRIVGNLCAMEVIHAETRPVDGFTDPQLHGHTFALNAVFDPVEQKWKAGQFGDVKRDAPYYEACFDARYTARLVELGYQIERRGASWEIASVPDSVVKLFSRRTAVIDAKAAELGIHDARRKSGLGAKTREKKDHTKSLPQSQEEWISRIPADTLQAMLKAAPVPGKGSFGKGIERSPQAAVDFAIGHSFERLSVISERQLFTAAIKQTLGAVPVATLEDLIRRDPRLTRREIKGEMMVTTQEVMDEEKWMIAFARNGRGTQLPLAPHHVIKDDRLNEDQRAAVMHVVTSTDRVVMVRGGAGTGKTTLMTEAVGAMQTFVRDRILDRDHVTLLAPSADASRGVLRAEGFEKADTVAKFLSSKRLQERAKGGVLWVDEAGLLGTKTMAALFRVADGLDARVILSGDPRQHRSVERGDPLRLFQTYAGIKPARVEEILRQRGLYKSAVRHFSDGNLLKGFDSLEKLGFVHEMNQKECHRHIAWNYANVLEQHKAKARDVRQKKFTAIVIAPTHAEGSQVTTAIRQELKRRGMLRGDGQSFDRLENLRLTDAEKATAGVYEKGLIVQFHENVPGFKAGQRYIVLGHMPGIGVTVGVASPSPTQATTVGGVLRSAVAASVVALGTAHTLPLDRADAFTVYRRHDDATELCVGDSIRITANGRTAGDPKSLIRGLRPHALNNGATYQVARFSHGDIILSNGWRVGLDFGHFTHGYCTTSHASQGKSPDCVFVAASTNSFGAVSAEQCYVSVSRGKHEAHIFTDDKAGLRRHIERHSEKLAAVDLCRPDAGKGFGSQERVRPSRNEETQRKREHAHEF